LYADAATKLLCRRSEFRSETDGGVIGMMQRGFVKSVYLRDDGTVTV